jgi:hypothetical protein
MNGRQHERGNACIGCGARLEGHVPVLKTPNPRGTLSICFSCGNIAVLEPDGTLRELTPDEWATLSDDQVEMLAHIEQERTKLQWERRKGQRRT